MFIRNHGSAIKRNAKKEQKAVKSSTLDNAEFIGAVASSSEDTSDMVAGLMEQVAAVQEENATLQQEVATLKEDVAALKK